MSRNLPMGTSTPNLNFCDERPKTKDNRQSTWHHASSRDLGLHFQLLAKRSSCSQVMFRWTAAHPLLSSITERHLFAYITVYLAINSFHSSPIDGYLVPQLSSRLSQWPYLANQIRGIAIDDGSYRSSNSLEELSTILLLILCSEKFSLCNIERLKMTRKFRSTLLDYLRTSHMQEIYLQHSHNFPLAILDDARNIKILKVRASRCNFKHCASHTPTSLESFFLVDVESVYEYITWAVPRAKNLISLHVKTTMVRFPNLSPILDACMESLRSLTLDVGPLCTLLILTSMKHLLHTYIP